VKTDNSTHLRGHDHAARRESDDEVGLAAEIGVQAQHEYVNGEGQMVRWCFRGIIEIQDLCEAKITHGVEVFSKMLRRSDHDREP
jgi:hypothetical protein